MDVVVPSFLAKIGRAEKHLVELKDSIERYGGSDADSRPYAVRTRIEGKKKRKVHRLHFTRSPANTDIPVIAADAIYNLRSSLEHLMAAMAPAKGRDSLTFPIFWQGVWEPLVEGENERRRKARHQWRAIDRAIPSDAVAYLKRLQPPDDAGEGEVTHGLRVLNRLSNTDRHSKLPIVAGGLKTMALWWDLEDGTHQIGLASANPDSFVEDDAEIKDAPEGAVDVEIVGTPVVVIRTRQNRVNGKKTWANVELLDALPEALRFIRDEVMPPLLPFVRKRRS